jgi:hypothetical protein
MEGSANSLKLHGDQQKPNTLVAIPAYNPLSSAGLMNHLRDQKLPGGELCRALTLVLLFWTLPSRAGDDHLPLTTRADRVVVLKDAHTLTGAPLQMAPPSKFDPDVHNRDALDFTSLCL